jgi:myo-inositol 2-dehydrogenase/D-chiro-inositol 1-dehydrogenase
MVGYQRRFDPSFVKLKESIASGAIGKQIISNGAKSAGKVNILRLTSRDHPPPPIEVLSSAGSFFQDFSTHDVVNIYLLLP